MDTLLAAAVAGEKENLPLESKHWNSSSEQY
jgi:hypothetical protein